MDQHNKRGLGRKAAVAGMLGLAGIGMSACDVAAPDNAFFDFLRMGVPEGITPEATAIGNMWVWTWVTAWIIGIIMWTLFLVAVFRWNAKSQEKRGKGEFPKQLQYNIPLELVLTIIPVVIVMTLFLFTVQAQDKATALDKNPEVKVDVTAFQWNWKFGYAEVDGSLTKDGKTYLGEDEARTKIAKDASVNENGKNPIHGRSQTDYSFLRFNDIETVGTSEEIPVLVLPSQTPIQFQLASADVSHGFWIPEFLFKRDTYAHPEANQQERNFQVEEITKEGAFVGRCTELCGTYHAMMNFELRVVSRDKFADYLEFRRANPEATNAQALESIGEAPYATSTHPFKSDRLGTRDGDNFIDHNRNV